LLQGVSLEESRCAACHGHTGVVNDLAFVPSSSAGPGCLATCADDGEVRLWSITSSGAAQCLSSFRPGTGASPVTSLLVMRAPGSDAALLVTGCEANSRVQLWGPWSGAAAPPAELQSLRLERPDGAARLRIASDSNTNRHSPTSPARLRIASRAAAPPRRLAASPPRRLAASPPRRLAASPVPSAAPSIPLCRGSCCCCVASELPPLPLSNPIQPLFGQT